MSSYLSTITSKEESDFIRLKTKGVGYIGASDKDVEGEWRWLTGPEGMENIGKGRLFWRGTGAQAVSNPTVYGPVSGAFNNWDRLEPNNALQGTNYENYGHITVFPNDPVNSYKWNDVEDKGGSGAWYPMGYIIEYGGMPGDPELNLTASVELFVNTVSFAPLTTPTICQGQSVVLNEPDVSANPAKYLWTPSETLSSATVANPTATPMKYTSYSVTGTRGACSSTVNYAINVNPQPVTPLKPVENICTGQTITLDAGDFPSYSWSTGATTRTITVGAAGDYSIRLVSDKGCPALLSARW